MRPQRFTEEQIIGMLKEQEAGENEVGTRSAASKVVDQQERAVNVEAQQEAGVFEWRPAMTMTHEEVLSVLGPADEATVAEIILTKASIEELREALAWLTNDEALIGQGRPLPGTRVAALIEVLEAEQPDEASTDPINLALPH
jgi:hypothetical protein